MPNKAKVHIKNPGKKGIWYRAYTDVEGSGFTGSDTDGQELEITKSYDSKFVVWSWMYWKHGEQVPYEPNDWYPLIPDMTITFHDDKTTISHYKFSFTNNSARKVWIRTQGGQVQELVVNSGESKDMVFEEGFDTICYAYFADTQPDSFTGTPLSSNLRSGQHFTFKDDNDVTCENLRLNLPVSDIPIKFVNHLNETVYIRYYTDDTNYQTDYVSANTPPYVGFLDKEPLSIEYSVGSGPFTPVERVPYKKGMCLTFYPTGMSGMNNDVLFALQKIGLRDKYGVAFAQHDLDYDNFLDLTVEEMKEIGLPIGPRKRLLKYIQQQNKNSTSSVSSLGENYTYDLFLSHRQVNGADLVCAIKLQLEVMFPDKHIRSFLDVDDLNNIHILEENVINSKNFLLLITEGALERPFVQKEIIAAVQRKKNIILVHDERSCKFPTGEGLPEEVKQVLQIKAIPYYREKAFRTVCIQQIFSKMVW